MHSGVSAPPHQLAQALHPLWADTRQQSPKISRMNTRFGKCPNWTSPNYWGLISNRYLKVMFKIPKKGLLPTMPFTGFTEGMKKAACATFAETSSRTLSQTTYNQVQGRPIGRSPLSHLLWDENSQRQRIDMSMSKTSETSSSKHAVTKTLYIKTCSAQITYSHWSKTQKQSQVSKTVFGFLSFYRHILNSSC